MFWSKSSFFHLKYHGINGSYENTFHSFDFIGTFGVLIENALAVAVHHSIIYLIKDFSRIFVTKLFLHIDLLLF